MSLDDTSGHTIAGAGVLNDPHRNKGTAFTLEKREHELATYAARLLRIADECFIVAAEASADQVGQDLRDKGMLFPSQANILETEEATATRVAEHMFDQSLATTERSREIRPWIEAMLYKLEYKQET